MDRDTYNIFIVTQIILDGYEELVPIVVDLVQYFKKNLTAMGSLSIIVKTLCLAVYNLLEIVAVTIV